MKLKKEKKQQTEKVLREKTKEKQEEKKQVIYIQAGNKGDHEK